MKHGHALWMAVTLAGIAVSGATGGAIASGKDDAEPRDEQAAALLALHCLDCHNPSTKKGGLDLTRREAALAGGKSGKVVHPGNADASELVRRVEAGEMPPQGRPKLGKDEVALLRQWVAAGARWAADPIDVFRYSSDRRAGYDWWSLQPLRAVGRPEVSNSKWPINEIDYFVAQRLEKAGLAPAPAAQPRTLIRRLYFDLVGLPPSPDDMEYWLGRLTGRQGQLDQTAYSELVDELLASPHHGERWARHWLDLVRFGESQGFERNKFRPSAWKFRDFVVEALNADMPYDQFVRWQLAGDVLEPDDPLAVIASGFLALGPYDLTAYNNGLPEMRAFAREEELEGLVGTVCETFLGLTVHCARCHDHKFDPIRQTEFYQISAALGGTYQGKERDSTRPAARPIVDRRSAELRRELGALSESSSLSPRERTALAARRSRLEAVARLLDAGPVHTTVPRQPGPWHVLARGDYRKPGITVAPRGLAAVVGVTPDWKLDEKAPEAERRKSLAAWITDPSNPLPARVLVNRLWGWHFGRGLVRTPNDFGFQGGLPSHPELLDWLAGQLAHPGEGPAWSLRRIQRLIVTSATYQQSSRGNPAAMKVDASNELLWRYAPQRLEAETFRDAVLAVSGELNREIGGKGFIDYTVKSAGDNENYTVFDAVGPEFNRRSLYRTVVRSGTSPLLDALDCPDPSVPTPRRSVTTTPLQALTLLNNKFVEHYAARFADSLKKEASDPAALVERAYARAFARPPTAQEVDFGRDYIAARGLAEYCLVLFNVNEFLFVD